MAQHPASSRRRDFKRAFARNLRANPTEAERKFWTLLRGKQLLHLRFRRQQPLGPYVADFYCPAAKLVVELDGGQHASERTAAYDEGRSDYLTAHGLRVLRFWNTDLLRDPEAVLEAIRRAVMESGIPLPETLTRFDPPSRGG